jgi:serine protease AprX
MRKSAAAAVRFALALTCVAATAAPARAQILKLDPLVRQVTALTTGRSPVIVRAVDPSSLPLVRTAILALGGTLGQRLSIIDAQAAVVPNVALLTLAANPLVSVIAADRTAVGSMERTGATIGSTAVRQELGVDGTGVGIAVIDSGVFGGHDDLNDAVGGRVTAFVDLVNGRSAPYDDYGHGTHVAGIIAGNGTDSNGARSGVAPGASLVVIKALDAGGAGKISDVIAGMDYVLAHKVLLHIRVVNLSVSAGVYESYNTDLLTLAAKRLVDAGITVIAAAGNAGRNPSGVQQYGGITAPGNAPWVLTVGASSHMGTVDRSDDTVAVFSSRGPTAFDYAAKPDLVAPGVGIESLSAPNSTFYSTKNAYLLPGTVDTSFLPYLSLSGTSMATPVVAGTVALMLQANPSLTPNAVKAILQYTSQMYPAYNRLQQGVGFANAKGAVELAAFLGGSLTSPPATDGWSRELIWGTHLLRGGSLSASASAWATTVTWGQAFTVPLLHTPVTWGTLDGTGAPWRTACADLLCTQVVWGSPGAPNVVWGDTCGSNDCQTRWTVAGAGTAVSSNSDDGTVVWGSNDDSTVVWGSSSDDGTVVWGSSDDGTVVWGSADDSTVVWGSNCADCEPVIWPH